MNSFEIGQIILPPSNYPFLVLKKLDYSYKIVYLERTWYIEEIHISCVTSCRMYTDIFEGIYL